jgi:hypothetical protein
VALDGANENSVVAALRKSMMEEDRFPTPAKIRENIRNEARYATQDVQFIPEFVGPTVEDFLRVDKIVKEFRKKMGWPEETEETGENDGE